MFYLQDEDRTSRPETDRGQSAGQHHVPGLHPHGGLAPQAAGQEEPRGSLHPAAPEGRWVRAI